MGENEKDKRDFKNGLAAFQELTEDEKVFNIQSYENRVKIE